MHSRMARRLGENALRIIQVDGPIHCITAWLNQNQTRRLRQCLASELMRSAKLKHLSSTKSVISTLLPLASHDLLSVVVGANQGALRSVSQMLQSSSFAGRLRSFATRSRIDTASWLVNARPVVRRRK